MIEWEIIARKIKGEASEEEEQIFQAWLAEDDSHRKYYEKAEKAWNEECSEPRKADIERLIERFDWFADRTPRRQAPVRRMNWSLAAAGVAILLAAGGILWLKQKEVPAVQTVAQAQHEAIEPGRPQARIILADGQTVNLTGRDSVTVLGLSYAAATSAVALSTSSGSDSIAPALELFLQYSILENAVHRSDESTPALFPSRTNVFTDVRALSVLPPRISEASSTTADGEHAPSTSSTSEYVTSSSL